MNKMISFRDLIDLEPKPEKVKYDEMLYTYRIDGRYFDKNNDKELKDKIHFSWMKEPNIEIIEEDKKNGFTGTKFYKDGVEILSVEDIKKTKEDKPRIEKLEIKQGVGKNHYYLENEEGIKCGMPKHALVMSNKINELCDIINDMEKER